MPIFAPFSYLANPIVEPWDPSDFTNVQYWWRADLGVTTTGTGVSAWEDQINAFTMVQNTDANRPTNTTSSDLNNQSVLRTNGTSDYLFTSTTPASRTGDFTTLMVYDLASTTPGAGVVFGVQRVAGGSVDGRTWLDGLNGNQRSLSEGFGSTAVVGTNVESPATAGAHAFKYRYDSSAGDDFYALDTLTETTKGTAGNTGQDWFTSSTIGIGALLNSTAGTVFGGRYISMDFAEAVMVYGTPTTDEMNEWKTYVNNRYGTIIS